MKTLLISIFFLLSSFTSFSQDDMKKYDSLIQLAYSKYLIGDFKSSAHFYSDAFKSIEWKAYPNDRYNAACAWSLANVPDSAFFQLNNLANRRKYSNIEHITTDKDLFPLHTDKRWKPLLKTIKKNKAEIEKDYDHKIVKQLDQIIIDDQSDRGKLDEIQQKHGMQSPQMDSIWKVIGHKDSINLVQVEKILSKKGWLGPKVIGYQGVGTIFLVIQHADLKTQEKYLPMMREANKKGEFESSSLALLEDRIANRNGKLQIYGSQVSFDKSTQLYYLLPVEDPDNLDKRRAEMNLGPISEYLSNWDIKWNIEEYKQKLPYYIELQNKQN